MTEDRSLMAGWAATRFVLVAGGAPGSTIEMVRRAFYLGALQATIALRDSEAEPTVRAELNAFLRDMQRVEQ